MIEGHHPCASLSDLSQPPALTNEPPFVAIQAEPQLILALAQGRSPSQTNISLYPQQVKYLLANCWSHQLKERPTATSYLYIAGTILLRLEAADRTATIAELFSDHSEPPSALAPITTDRGSISSFRCS